MAISIILLMFFVVLFFEVYVFYILGDACSYVVFVINVTPVPVLHHKSPFELLYGHIPDYNKCSKFRPRSTPCLSFGSLDKHKGFKCCANRILIARHVHFVEDSPGYEYVSYSSANFFTQFYLIPNYF